MPGFNLASGSSGRTFTVNVRLRESPVGKTLVTAPLNGVPGYALTLNVAALPSRNRAIADSSTLSEISVSRDINVATGVVT